jgi:hypothetical protein
MLKGEELSCDAENCDCKADISLWRSQGAIQGISDALEGTLNNLQQKSQRALDKLQQDTRLGSPPPRAKK